jgi:hypothetical protein
MWEERGPMVNGEEGKGQDEGNQENDQQANVIEKSHGIADQVLNEN